MSEIRQAFEHPEVRASATAAEAPHDRISLRDHVVEVEIGAFQAERGVRQRVVFNVVVELTPVSGPIDDDVDASCPNRARFGSLSASKNWTGGRALWALKLCAVLTPPRITP